MLSERKTILLWTAISILLPMLLFAAISRAQASTSKTPEQPQFTGIIDAVYEKRYLKIVSKENIVFTVDTDAIQRITYTSNEKFKGLVFYPLEQKVMFFRRSGPLKFYTVLTQNDYEHLMAKHIANENVEEHDIIGFSTHFLHLIKTNKVPTPIDKTATHEGHPCETNAWNAESKTSDAHFIAEHCQHIAVPRAWLRYTDLNIPTEISGFPYKFVKQVTDNASSSTSMFDDMGVEQLVDKESTAGKFVTIAGKTLRKAARAADELEEFTYQVVKLAPGPVKKTSFIDLFDFIRVDTLEELQASFPDHPNYRDSSSNSGSAYRSRGSSGMSDIFD